MLRNLNQRSSGRRICGTSHSGTKGSLIPAGSAIRNLATPADDNKEYKLRLLTWPASGSLFMYEDGSSVFIPTVNGTFTATGQIAENGIDIGSPVTITYQSGTTVACSVGAASAAGASASVQYGVTISCSVGAASAGGSAATITSTATGLTIACGLGAAGASGAAASIYQGMTIAALAGNATAAGTMASIVTDAPYRQYPLAGQSQSRQLAGQQQARPLSGQSQTYPL